MVAVLGGDGSLGCVIDMIIKDDVIAENLGKFRFTCLPFGTGNDIGRSLGWGGTEGRLARDLKYMVKRLVTGKREKFTLWEVEFQAE